jgi:uncharacterized protein (DUF433 family)
MSILDQAEKIVHSLSRSEKIQLLESIVRDLDGDFPGIERHSDVSGGDACIIRTRIPVWLIENARRLGSNEAELLASYPSIRPSDLANAWAYARTHADEIDQQIRENEAA